MTAAEIAARLGRARRSGQWWRSLCPVRGSRTGRGATLALRDGEQGLIMRCWAGCYPHDVVAALVGRRLIGGACTKMRPVPPAPASADPDDSASRIDLAPRIWAASRDAARTLVARCLAGRGIIVLPSPLRYAPSLRSPDDSSSPALVAHIDNSDGELIGISRTWLYLYAAGIWRRRDHAKLRL